MKMSRELFPGANSSARTLNGSHSEDSVAETALSKKNSDGKCYLKDLAACYIM